VKRTFEQRLWSRIDASGDGCWEWTGYRTRAGYGQIGNGRKLVAAHRAAWASANGEIPAGMLVRHRCDNPPCCRPDHLELGTNQDNVQDAVDRGRTARGLRLPHTRLTDDDVRAIRARYHKYTIPGTRGYRTNTRELASEFGISRRHVLEVARGRQRGSVG
jgi:hypothetical protein